MYVSIVKGLPSAQEYASACVNMHSSLCVCARLSASVPMCQRHGCLPICGPWLAGLL